MKITLCNLLDDKRVELDPNARIEFGEGINRITVSVIDDAIHICADSRLVVMPRAANLVWVRSDWR